MRVLLGLSGGVDSAYAVHKLKLMGHSVEGAVIKMHPHTEISEAEAAASALGIPLHVIDGEELFKEKVISNFIREYKAGRTPNPCVVCNSEVKFKLLFDYAMENGFDRIATGHYADVVEIEDSLETRYAIKRSADEKKDQTYMLWRLPPEILSRLILPLSSVKKEEVKKDALEMAISAASRRESQEICFIPDNDYPAYIEKAAGRSPEGDFIDEDGRILGRHKGIIHYTVGQRKGLGIALGERAFITKIDPFCNTITLSTKDASGNSFIACDLVFSGLKRPLVNTEIRLFVKLRYQAPLSPATIKFNENGEALVVLDTSVRAITPGQSAVFYKDGILQFGGVIDRIL